MSKYFPRLFFAVFLIITIIFATIFFAVQQPLTLLAYYPQVEIADDLTKIIALGQNPNLTPSKIGLADTLAPFVIVYDDQFHILLSTITIDARASQPPKSAFLNSKQTGGTQFVWEPLPHLSEAAIITRITGPYKGYLLVGRSQQEVDTKKTILLLYTVGGWLACELIIILAFNKFSFFKKTS